MQNVNINQEVENAMMAPPQQPRGIVDLLASELKARDAKARNQLNTMMAPAPDSNTIISQNEKETENNVRQEITQKMQSMAVKENQNKARMNQALAGIAGQRANNMTRMANGGIIGYAGPDGSKVEAMAPQTPMAGQTQNPSPGYLDPAVATFLRELQELNKQLEAAFPQEKDLFEQKITDLMNTTSPRVKRIASDSQFGLPKKDGMAMGGIVGYATGGEIEAYLDSIGAGAEYKANLTPEQTAAIGEMLDSQATPQANKGVVERMAEVGRKMPGSNLGDRPVRNAVVDMLDSPVARGQNEVLSALPSGAMGLLQDRMSELGPVSQGAAGANEEATERRRTGIAETLQNAMPEEGIVGRMARVGRQMPGSNLGDRPVRDAMMEGIASLAPPKNPGATSEAARQFNRAAMQARNTRDPNTVSEFQQGLIDAGGANVTDQLNAAQRRVNAEKTVSMADIMRNPATAPAIREAASDFAEGLGLNNLNDMVNSGIQSVRDSDFFSGVPSLEELYPALPEDSSGSYRVGRGINAAAMTIPKVLSGFLQPERGMTFADVAPMAEDLGRGILGVEQGTRTPTEAEEIIASGPSTTPAASAEPAYDPMKGVEAVANPNLRRAIEGAQAAPAPTGIAAAAAEQDGEVAATQLASTVASNPTPENMSRFESEIQRLMEKRESPVRALSSFLKSFSQARGGSMGQNLAIATTAMNAADDAMDKQIIALEQLRRADQISERDFGLKQEQLTSQKGLLDAQASYYKNYKDMQVEIAELKEKGDTEIANRRLYQSILDLAANNRPAYLMAAKAELGVKDMFSPEVTAKANEMMKQAVQTEYRDAQRFFDLPETDGAGLGADVRSELETYVGQQ